MTIRDHLLKEASSAEAVGRFNELSKLLSGAEKLENRGKLEDAHMKTKKQAAKIFQQAIQLLKGL